VNARGQSPRALFGWAAVRFRALAYAAALVAVGLERPQEGSDPEGV